MDELCREYGIVRANRVRNSNLTFDFSKPNMNGILVIGFILMTILAFITKEYSLLLFDAVVIIYFIIVKIQNQKINFKTGFISFKDNSIIRTVSFGYDVIDCTKGITISIGRNQHIHTSYDSDINERLMNEIFKEKDITYELIVEYKDNNDKEQKIVFTTTTSDNSRDDFEEFITNFYYEEEPKKNKENNEVSNIRFCM